MDPQDNSHYDNDLQQFLSDTLSTAVNPPPQAQPAQGLAPVHQQGLMNPRPALYPEFDPTNAYSFVSQLNKKPRGRPRKETVGDVPYLEWINVNSGENIVSALSAFTHQQLPGTTVSVLFALGSINSGTLGPTGIFQGENTIISMIGAFRLSETNVPTGRLTVSLSASDGRMFGGNVTGELIASSPVMIAVLISKANGKGSNSTTPPPSKKSKRGAPPPSSSTPQLL